MTAFPSATCVDIPFLTHCTQCVAIVFALGAYSLDPPISAFRTFFSQPAVDTVRALLPE
jgi:hypothetical protein